MSHSFCDWHFVLSRPIWLVKYRAEEFNFVLIPSSSVIWTLGGSSWWWQYLRNVHDNVSTDQEIITDKIFADTNVWAVTERPEMRITFTLGAGQYFHLTRVNYDDENMTLFTRINMCDTLCDITSMAPSCCCRGCCCCCWCQVLLLLHKRLYWPIRGQILSVLTNQRAGECNLSSHPTQQVSHLSCWVWTGPYMER